MSNKSRRRNKAAKRARKFKEAHPEAHQSQVQKNVSWLLYVARSGVEYDKKLARTKSPNKKPQLLAAQKVANELRALNPVMQADVIKELKGQAGRELAGVIEAATAALMGPPAGAVKSRGI